jgi:uncharacterized protein (TIGR03000 family)
MKKFVSLAAFGLVALFVAQPTPAAAGSFSIGGIGRIGSIGGVGGYIGRPRALLFGWGGYGRSDWSPYRPVFRRAWRADYYYPNGGASYYYPYPVYYPDAGVSYYYPPTAYYPQDQAVDVNKATVRMSVPSGARVWFEDEPTSQTGRDRLFVSPALTPGRNYVYHVRVQWDDDGKAVERHRDVAVHAGDRINLNIDK